MCQILKSSSTGFFLSVRRFPVLCSLCQSLWGDSLCSVVCVNHWRIFIVHRHGGLEPAQASCPGAYWPLNTQAFSEPAVYPPPIGGLNLAIYYRRAWSMGAEKCSHRDRMHERQFSGWSSLQRPLWSISASLPTSSHKHSLYCVPTEGSLSPLVMDTCCLAAWDTPAPDWWDTGQRSVSLASWVKGEP